MSYIKTAQSLLKTTATVANTITATSELAHNYVTHELTKQALIQQQELDLGLYLKRSKAEQLLELKELLAELPEDIAQQITGE